MSRSPRPTRSATGRTVVRRAQAAHRPRANRHRLGRRRPVGALAGLWRVSHAAGATLDLGTILAEVATGGIGGSIECCAIFLWRPETDEVEVAAATSRRSWPGTSPSGSCFSLAEWGSFREALSRDTPFTVHADDPRLAPVERDWFAKLGFASLVLAPMLVGGEWLGFVVLCARQTDAALAIAHERGADVAAQAARAVHLDNLLTATRRLADEQAALFRISQAAISGLQPGTMLADIAQATIGLAGAECCGIDLWRPETDELICAAEATVPSWPGVEPAGTVYPIDDWPSARRVLEEGITIFGSVDDPNFDERERAAFAAAGVRGAVIVPLRVGTNVLGLMMLYSRLETPVASADLRLAGEVAAVVALAIHNAQLHEEARADAIEKTALLRVSRAVLSDREIATILSEIANASLGVAGIEACTIERWQPGSNTTQIVADAKVDDWPEMDTSRHPGTLDHRPIACSLLLGECDEASFTLDQPTLPLIARLHCLELGVGAGFAVPLVFGRERLGMLTIWARRSEPFSQRSVHFAHELAGEAARAIDRARLQAALRERADTDGLTGVLNHRAILEHLDRALADASADGSSVAVLLVDIDDFKQLNDTYGHLAGDRILRDVTSLLKSTVRDHDRVGRYGGDEFLVVIRATDSRAAQAIADRLRDYARATTIETGELKVPLRLSIGLSLFPLDATIRSDLIARADEAMYAAKHAGDPRRREEVGHWAFDQSSLGNLLGLLDIINQRDQVARRHAEQVSAIAAGVARRLGRSADEVAALEIAGLLHDVGKIAIPEKMLRAPGGHSPHEEAALRQHVAIGLQLVHGVAHERAVREAIAAHHERWDGSGYPAGQRGEAIPLLGRILALADAYSNLTLDHRTQPALPPVIALDRIRTGAGTQFDPALVEPLLDTIAGEALATTWSASSSRAAAAD